jgi:hypothetical protein
MKCKIFTSNRSLVRLAFLLPITYYLLPITSKALAKEFPSGAIVSGCDSEVCVVARFDGDKWRISTKKDDRANGQPTISFENFNPRRTSIAICTGKKCLNGLVDGEGELTVRVENDLRTYKAPSIEVTNNF